MRKTFTSSITTVVSAMVFLLNGNALADAGPSPWIHRVMQERQDVVVTLQIPLSGQDGFSEKYDLTRRGDGDEKKVLDDEIFDPLDAAFDGQYCNYYPDMSEVCANIPPECATPDAGSLEQCDGVPWHCEDCDDDGTPECPTSGAPDYVGYNCESAHFFEIVDYCVPAGIKSYTLSWGTSSPYPKTITVTDSGEQCVVPSDILSDDPSAVNCSITQVGRDEPNGPLALLLIGFGVIALLIARRRADPR